jgi:hypothetical protein
MPSSEQAPSNVCDRFDDEGVVEEIVDVVVKEPIATIANRNSSTARNGTDFIYGSRSK